MLDDKPDHFTDSDDDNPFAGSSSINHTNRRESAADDDPFAPSQPQPSPSYGRSWRSWRSWLYLLVGAAVIALAIGFCLRYLVADQADAVETGYIYSVARKGIIFKTWEGEMISQRSINDTTRVYQRDFTFSVPDDSLALLIQNHQGSGHPVKLRFNTYHGTLPWRGSSRNIVTAVE